MLGARWFARIIVWYDKALVVVLRHEAVSNHNIGRFRLSLSSLDPKLLSLKSDPAAEAARRGISEGEVEHEYLAGQSIKRFVEPSEIADLCLFLSTPASRMITGQAIAIDGHTEAYHL